MSLDYRLNKLITRMCGNMDESTLRAVILSTIPYEHQWSLSYDHGSRLPVNNGDELVFGDRDSGHIDALDQIRLAVTNGDQGNIQRADQVLRELPSGLEFYNLLLILYYRWRGLHLLGASDTDSTSGSVHSEPDLDMGVPQKVLDVHAKLNALRMSMRK
jgi:hypothetical protein